MYSTAALMLANIHIAELYAPANRERLAGQIRSSGMTQAGRSPVAWLRVGTDRIGRIVRALPRVTAG